MGSITNKGSDCFYPYIVVDLLVRGLWGGEEVVGDEAEVEK